METEGLQLDRLSSLPPHIIHTMLTLMPIRDAFRTCILSRNWRYHSLNIPKLAFSDELFSGSDHDSLSIKCKLMHVIYPVLLLHHGPILEFGLFIGELSSCSEIDQIIYHLSRNTSLKIFAFGIWTGDGHKLLSSFYHLPHLTHIKLHNCVIQPPSTFNGFTQLTSLYFSDVSITIEVLLRFLSKCPLLKKFTLIDDEKHLIESGDSDFVELLKCLPLIEYLCMNSYPIKCFATSVTPQKLPTQLLHLEGLKLHGLCFAREVDLHSIILLVTNSPNIEHIKIEISHSTEATSQTVTNFLDLQDYSYVMLDHLRELEITHFYNMKPLMDFVKFILAKSPMLKKLEIVIENWVTIHDEVKMLRDLLQYQRVSVKLEIIFKRP